MFFPQLLRLQGGTDSPTNTQTLQLINSTGRLSENETWSTEYKSIGYLNYTKQFSFFHDILLTFETFAWNLLLKEIPFIKEQHSKLSSSPQFIFSLQYYVSMLPDTVHYSSLHWYKLHKTSLHCSALLSTTLHIALLQHNAQYSPALHYSTV